MRKFLCLVLSLAMLCLVGCGADKDVNSSGSEKSGIEQTITAGTLKEAKYKIGDNADEVNNYYKKVMDDYEAIHMGENAGVGHEDEAHIHDANDEDKIPYYDLNEEGNYFEIDVADYRFYYEKDNKSKGIVAIATDSDIFGFVMGYTTKSEVEKSVDKTGKTIKATDTDKVFVAFPQENMIIFRLEYEEEEKILDFYFFENMLVTVVLKSY